MDSPLSAYEQSASEEVKVMDERPKFETPHDIARRIVCKEWQRAVKEFGLTPGSVTEKVVGRIINELDETARPTHGQSADDGGKNG